MLFCSCALSPFWRELFLRSASLGEGVSLDRGVFAFAKCILFSLSLKTLSSNSKLEL
jgi:hypothetical protein